MAENRCGNVRFSLKIEEGDDGKERGVYRRTRGRKRRLSKRGRERKRKRREKGGEGEKGREKERRVESGPARFVHLTREIRV